MSTTTSKPAAIVSPTVPGGAYTSRAATALSQSLSITAPSGTTTSYALSGAPAGATVDTTGTLKWAAPVAGSYSFVAKATTAAGASASGTYSLKVIPGTTPAISGGSFAAKAGVAFAASLSATNPNGGTLAYSVTGAPVGRRHHQRRPAELGGSGVPAPTASPRRSRTATVTRAPRR